ncbi:hypothetical protein ACHAWU_006464 [Discostella pseudostelligera]|uniref:Peptidase M20 dimerisation domain-containing protein n=1 Tax=Discostella pseudostelligera TaxID=259834 RepID=A0ABD3N512_9STRA
MAAAATTTTVKLSPDEAEAAISSFQSILRIPTVSSTAPTSGAYVACAQYILSHLQSIPCLASSSFLLEESKDSNYPVVIAKWEGVHPDWPVIILNSHYDVVPAILEDWTVDPFGAERRDGKIYGRGAQDMKCVCIQYMEAIRKLHTLDPTFIPQRTIYLTFVPDEEVGGSGMLSLISSTLYRSLPGRLPWWIDVTATGPTGHGSRFIDCTAVEQIIGVSNRALAFRKEQRDLLHGDAQLADHSNCAHAVAAKRHKMLNEKRKNGKVTLGDVTSLNITTLEAGVKVEDTYAYNCVPPMARCSLDIRISPHVEPKEISDMMDTWCRECSSSVEEGYEVKWKSMLDMGPRSNTHAVTEVDANINPWYGVFSSAMRDMGYEVVPQIFPAATDSRFLRQLGVRAFGFSPMRNTEIMLHENDEYLEESIFIEGIEVYVGLIKALGSVTEFDADQRQRKKVPSS